MNDLLTIAKRLTWTKYNLETKSLSEILEMIKTGSYQLHDDQIGDYNLSAVTSAIRKEADNEKRKQMKALYLPVVTFNGIWDGSKISQYSNVTALDFDHIQTQDEMDEILNQLKSKSCVVSIFRTFKQYRLKAIILHDNKDPYRHGDMYELLMSDFGITYLDENCKDLSRKSFLAWDEYIWINSNPQPFHYEPVCRQPQVSYNQNITIDKKVKSPNSIINILNSSWRNNHPEYWKKGNRAVSIFKCACQFCEYGVPQDMSEKYFIKNWLDDDMGEIEICKHVAGAYKAAEYNSRIFY